MTKVKRALVLTGGGAMGAYQAGALHAIGDIVARHGIDTPFHIVTGNSAGAINAAWLASNIDTFPDATQRLRAFWDGLHTHDIFKTDIKSLIGRGLKSLWEISTGGLHHRKSVRSLLDTSPLWRLIYQQIDCHPIRSHIQNGRLDAIAITSVNYSTGDSRVFYDAATPLDPYGLPRSDALQTAITPKHVLGSAAIPILFPPVKIGHDYYGDGSLRNYTPMSPAIHLGATHLMVVAVRHAESTPSMGPQFPSIARILGVILNFVLLDAIDYDYRMLERVNSLQPQFPCRPIGVHLIRPQQDFGQMAMSHLHHSPRLLRYLIRGLGSDAEAADLFSYLLFESPYLTQLSQLGYDNTLSQEADILSFFRSSSP